MAGSRTVGDYVWTIVGVAGLVCIGVAVYMLIPRSNSPEDLAELAAEHYRAGEERLRAGDPEGAIEELERAAACVDGRNPLIQNLLGEALLASGKTDEAAGRWFAALTLAPLFPGPYENLARWFEKRGEHLRAASYYRTAEALYLEDMPADLDERRKIAFEESGEARTENLERALRDLAANPANPDALTFLLLHRLAEIRVPEEADALEGIRRAVGELGGSLPDLGDRIERQRAAVRDRPKSVVDRAGLGLLLLLAGDAEGGRVAAEAYDLSDTDPGALLAVGLADALAGGKDLARIEKAAGRLNGNPVLWLALGAAAIANGKTSAAKSALGNVLRLQPVLTALPAIPEVYRLHALALTDPDQATDKARFLKAYSRFFPAEER